jgi:hypothetical protein
MDAAGSNPNSDPHLDRQFHAAMVGIYTRAKDEAGYNATRYLQMVSETGGLATARQLLQTSGISDGFTHLWERGRLDLTVEALVLKPEWQRLFTSGELNTAQDRLKSYGFDFEVQANSPHD